MAFMGMRGTGDWATNQKPESWRQGILFLYPNGRAPLTAMMSMMRGLEINDTLRHWWTKTLQTQSVTITAGQIYTDASLTTAYTSGGAAGDELYVKMTAANVAHFRARHQVLLRDASDLTVDVNALVIEKVTNGASSYIKVRLLEADDNSGSGDISDVDTVMVIGNVNAQGATTPDSLKYDPVEYTNRTQIFRTPVSMTGSAIATTPLRTGDPWTEDRREALEYHSIEQEKAFWWSIASTGTGLTGKPENTMMGIYNFIKANAPSNILNFQTDTNYSGQSWIQGGEKFLDEALEQIFRYAGRGAGAADELMMFCGSGALLGLQRLVKTGAHISIKPGSVDYGINVLQWTTSFGTVYIKTHPLFNVEATNRNIAFLLHPANIQYCYLKGRDTDLYENVQIPGTDGRTDEYLTECTLELHHPETFGLLRGLGLDSAV